PDLGHREHARHRQVHDAGEEPVVVFLRAQVQHGRAEQAPLHPALDLHRRIAEHELLETGDVAAVVVVAAEVAREGAGDDPDVGEFLELLQHALPVLIEGQVLDLAELIVRHELANVAAPLGPLAVEEVADEAGVKWVRGHELSPSDTAPDHSQEVIFSANASGPTRSAPEEASHSSP